MSLANGDTTLASINRRLEAYESIPLPPKLHRPHMHAHHCYNFRIGVAVHSYSKRHLALLLLSPGLRVRAPPFSVSSLYRRTLHILRLNIRKIPFPNSRTADEIYLPPARLDKKETAIKAIPHQNPSDSKKTQAPTKDRMIPEMTFISQYPFI